MHQKIIIYIILLFSTGLIAQQPTQTIRGTIIDESSNLPLPFVSIGIQNSTSDTFSDSLGNFILHNVGIGRYNIVAALLGYEPVIIKEIQVTSAKEVVLNITMKENSNLLGEVIIKPKINKERPLNTMATVSARMLSVEEAKRFAGGFDDPARLVSAFAGVSGNVSNNAIVVRGNSPQSFQWKLEGIEVSNPNHFADLSAFGGGGLTALSTQLLANSDFFSGAMPAEYSNALSGVFDIFMRNGNNQKHEHTFQLGAIGLDAASEGPISKTKRSSYIFNFRYSTLGLVAPLLPENAAGTTYQDLAFKLNFPTNKAGTFSVWALGLQDHSDANAKDSITTWKYDTDRENQDVNQFMGVLGITHKVILNNKQYLKSTFATAANGLDLHTDRLDSNRVISPYNIIRNKYFNFITTSMINTKLNANHTNKSGFTITNMHYKILLENASTTPSIQSLVDENGNSNLVSAFSNSMLQLSNKLTLNIGLTGQWFTYNNAWSLEPRAGIRFNTTQFQTWSFAYGLHSRLERLNYYFIKNDWNQYINKDLGFSKAHHLILGYDLSTSDYTHLKIETYYQYLYDIPVIENTSFSLINQQNEWFFDKILLNKGKGRNYGMDITFEKYISNGYYYLATASIFNSQYSGGDKIWRNTRYNRKYAFNLLYGKEWLIGYKQNKILGLNVRLNYQGGDHYTPVDYVQSTLVHDVIFDETNAFSQQYTPSVTVHFTASYKINKVKTSHEFALKIINLNQYKEYAGFRYNHQTQTVDLNRELTFIPNLSYSVEF
ncbi:MAG: carboxypeptidase-like regulatory domain-containing protein [Saprospiraceae bacterium]|nr:carboxypeptidase-like regulatory domain-containing protein [Saprospiraceae bacterium]